MMKESNEKIIEDILVYLSRNFDINVDGFPKSLFFALKSENFKLVDQILKKWQNHTDNSPNSNLKVQENLCFIYVMRKLSSRK